MVRKFLLLSPLVVLLLCGTATAASAAQKGPLFLEPNQNRTRFLLQTETLTPTATGTQTATPPPLTPTLQATTTFTPSPPPPTPTSTASQTPQPTPLPPSPTPSPATITKPPPLSISGVEPSRIDQSTGGTLSIYGSGFTPTTAVRLVSFGLLDTIYVNATALRAVVPPNLPARRYDLEISHEDGATAVFQNAIRIVAPAEPTATATLSPAVNRGFWAPQLVIEAVRTDPEVVRPGDPFVLTLQIANRGDYAASGLVMTLQTLDLVAPRDGSNTWVVDRVGVDETVSVELQLILSPSAESGYSNLQVAMDYSDYLGRSHHSTQAISLSITTGLAEEPLVILTRYHTDPDLLTPGDSFTLHLEFTNVGGEDASQLTVTMGGEGGSGLVPFALIGSGNVQFIPSLSAGETVALDLQLIVDGSAASGLFDIPIQLAYDENQSNRLTQNQSLTLMVRRNPRLQIDFYRQVEPGVAGEQLELPIEVINIGRELVNISSMSVVGSGLEIVNGDVYLGPLDGGTSGTLDAVVIPKESGLLDVLVQVNYLDDFNQPQAYTRTLKVTVEEPHAANVIGAGQQSAEAQPKTLWQKVVRFIRAFFGLGS